MKLVILLFLCVVAVHGGFDPLDDEIERPPPPPPRRQARGVADRARALADRAKARAKSAYESLPICECSALESCKAGKKAALFSAGDKCKSHLKGVDTEKMKVCAVKLKTKIEQLKDCVASKMPEPICNIGSASSRRRRQTLAQMQQKTSAFASYMKGGIIKLLKKLMPIDGLPEFGQCIRSQLNVTASHSAVKAGKMLGGCKAELRCRTKRVADRSQMLEYQQECLEEAKIDKSAAIVDMCNCVNDALEKKFPISCTALPSLMEKAKGLMGGRRRDKRDDGDGLLGDWLAYN